MSVREAKSSKKTPKEPKASEPEVGASPHRPTHTPPLYRPIDWITLGITTGIVMLGYLLTLAPDLTLEDSGELAVGSLYAGIPHPPGYPVWTMYTWVFANFVPFSNIAWRVALGCAFAGALSCGLLGLMVSRGSSMMMEGIAGLQNMDKRWEGAICLISGFVSGCLLAFNGFMWSQSVIVEVYSLSALSLVGVLCCLLRWIYAPHQRRYLYWALFIFGISFTNHQTLILAALGVEVTILAVDKRIGRDLFMGNSVIYILGLIAKQAGHLTSFDANAALFLIFNLIGVGSIIVFAWLLYTTCKRQEDWLALGRDLALVLAILYVASLFGFAAEYLPKFKEQSGLAVFYHFFGLAAIGTSAGLAWLGPKGQGSSLLKYYRQFSVAAGFCVLALLIAASGGFKFLKGNLVVFAVYFFGSALFLGFWYWLSTRYRQVGTEIKVGVILAGMWTLGASFYLYMAIGGMSNPPMQWGYPRTLEGFFHALTRGQYEKTNPLNLFDDPLRFVNQVFMLVGDVASEFSWVFVFIALVPLIFLRKMQKRERAWVIGLTAIYFCLAVLLMILLNPNPDRQSRQLVRVFFTPSHVVVAMLIGYGLSLVAAYMATHYRNFRRIGLIGGVVAIVLAVWSLVERVGATLYGEGVRLGPTEVFTGIAQAFAPGQYGLPIFAGLLLLITAALFVAGLLVYRERAPLALSLALFASLPLVSVMSNWADNEQRGHLFGYWFGHDMFTPPFDLYPEMEKDTILFGGTDPGRFCPTYMIFCESFIPPRCKPKDPDFDRRDVYIITQNALADGTYLSYIRAHYFRSAQIDPPFFQELLRTSEERQLNYSTNYLARLAYHLLDRPFLALGARIEANRRARGVYPPEEIYTPSVDDSQRCFNEYMQDAQARHAQNKLRPGEQLRIEGGKVQIFGQVAVMAINGLLTKVIFDKNPTNEFYVEESFPLDWMYPHLTPYGIIMKINREPLSNLSEEILDRDHQFWTKYSERLIGNWITYDTPVAEITEFAEQTHLRHNYEGFRGDRKFMRDDQSQKAFSKLRSAIAGVYAWRLGPQCPPQYAPKTPEARQRLLKEADFAFRQALGFCPYSPEAVFRYVNLLISQNRLDDALLVARTCLKLDPQNAQVLGLVQNLENAKSQSPMALQNSGQIQQLIQTWAAAPTNFQVAFQLASAYLGARQTNRASAVLDEVLARAGADANAILAVARAYLQLGNLPKLESTLEQLTKAAPQSPEAWYDYAAVQAAVGKQSEAILHLERALTLSDSRIRVDTNVPNLRVKARDDVRFAPLRSLPKFQSLTSQR